MCNRLEVAKGFLARDGLIVVQINDKEQAYLKVLMDEVFDQNYRATIAVKMSHLSGVKMSHKESKIPKTMEYLHVFSISGGPIKIRPQYVKTSWDDAFDRYKSFIVKPEKDSQNISKWKVLPLRTAVKNAGIDESDAKAVENFRMSHADCIFQTTVNKSKDYPKEPKDQFLEVGEMVVFNGREVELASKKIREIGGVKVPTTIIGDIWTDIGINNVFQEGGKGIEMRFGKKPEMLLERIVKMFTDEGDLVLDFFAGTGTTVAVAHKLKRRWLAVEQLDYVADLTVPRLKNVVSGDKTGITKSVGWKGGGSFLYAELAASNSVFADRIETAPDMDALLDMHASMKDTGYLRYDVDMSGFDEREFADLPLDIAKRILMDCLDANHFYVNLGSLGDANFDISEEDAAATRSFYGPEK